MDGKLTICGGTVNWVDRSKCFSYDKSSRSWESFPELNQARRYTLT